MNEPTSTKGAIGAVSQRLGAAAVLLCVGFVLTGAVYFGLASCGGNPWHGAFFRGTSVVLYVLALVFPSTLLASLRAKLAFAVAVPAAYVLVESGVAPFYPGPPESLQEYGKLVIQSLEFGPCG